MNYIISHIILFMIVNVIARGLKRGVLLTCLSLILLTMVVFQVSYDVFALATCAVAITLALVDVHALLKNIRRAHSNRLNQVLDLDLSRVLHRFPRPKFNKKYLKISLYRYDLKAGFCRYGFINTARAKYLLYRLAGAKRITWYHRVVPWLVVSFPFIIDVYQSNGFQHTTLLLETLPGWIWPAVIAVFFFLYSAYYLALSKRLVSKDEIQPLYDELIELFTKKELEALAGYIDQRQSKLRDQRDLEQSQQRKQEHKQQAKNDQDQAVSELIKQHRKQRQYVDRLVEYSAALRVGRFSK